MNDEYKALRDEIIKWQDRRFDVLQFSISLVTALLGLKLVVDNPSINEVWPLISIVLLLYLCTANLLTWYAGDANARLAAYLQVFHETPAAAASGFRWETRLQKFTDNKKANKLNVNTYIAGIYGVLGSASVVIPGFPAEYSLSGNWISVFLPVLFILFLTTVVLLARSSYPREVYKTRWEDIQNGETNTSGLPMHNRLLLPISENSFTPQYRLSLLPRCYQDRANHPPFAPWRGSLDLLFPVGLACLRWDLLNFVNRRSNF